MAAEMSDADFLAVCRQHAMTGGSLSPEAGERLVRIEQAHATLIGQLAAVLETVEWSGGARLDAHLVWYGSCPACDASEYEGHAPDCALHAALVAAGRRG